MRETIIAALENAKSLLYQDTTMCLDLICEDLVNNYGLNATFQGKSIYIDDTRVASIRVCKEAPECVGIYGYTVLIKE